MIFHFQPLSFLMGDPTTSEEPHIPKPCLLVGEALPGNSPFGVDQEVFAMGLIGLKTHNGNSSNESAWERWF
jgi:hypothetical protein